jgi:hypothetical protein
MHELIEDAVNFRTMAREKVPLRNCGAASRFAIRIFAVLREHREI